jgi:hypothetical protein
LVIDGDARLGKPSDLPIKTALAPVTNQSYFDTTVREDRWFDAWLGGTATFSASATSAPAVTNVYEHRKPFPGLQWDRWEYSTLKKYALLYGSYYAQGTDGLLYANGAIVEGQGQSLDEVMQSDAVGMHHGLVFVDTLDQMPPTGENLGTLRLTTEYAEGLFVINANLSWMPRGAGKAVPALSPPPEGMSSLATRIPVELSGIHLNGVLFVAGNLEFQNDPRIFGAVTSTGELSTTGGGSMEIWYEHELAQGLYRGFPVVSQVSGTWQERY